MDCGVTRHEEARFGWIFFRAVPGDLPPRGVVSVDIHLKTLSDAHDATDAHAHTATFGGMDKYLSFATLSPVKRHETKDVTKT